MVEFENRYIHRDGSVRWLQWNARPVPEEGLIYSAARDVTESRRTRDEQAALRRVATLVAKGMPPAEVFAAVAREVGGLFGGASADVRRYERDDSVTVLGSAGSGAGATHDDVAAAVARARRTTRTDRAVGAPIVVEDHLWGVIAASAGAEPLPPDAEARLARFTELVATAIANAEAQTELAASRARIVVTADETRRRIQRNLHDGAQQSQVQTIVALKLVQQALDDDAGKAEELVEAALESAETANDELRELARGIHPAALTQGGLAPALKTMAGRSPIPVELDLRTDARLPERTEVAAYYVASEALTNAAKHSHASVVQVTADTTFGELHLSISDDGVGGADATRGSGLVGLKDRVEAIGGRLTVQSHPDGGTRLTVTLPINADSPPGR